jgi:hypothetical protein
MNLQKSVIQLIFLLIILNFLISRYYPETKLKLEHFSIESLKDLLKFSLDFDILKFIKVFLIYKILNLITSNIFTPLILLGILKI